VAGGAGSSEVVMAGDLSQDGRMAMLQTPLGKDVLVLSRFDGGESLGGLFSYHIEALSAQANIDFNQLLGLNLSVKMTTVDNLVRYFNGVLVEARWTGGRNDLYVYQLVLAPWLWLLSHTSDCRIFSSMTVPDIIAQVFQDRGFSDYRKALTGSYPTLEYCVQYRESDMNFVCRLMEEYGIYYFFEHTEDKHMLVLADSKSSHKPAPGLAPVPYLPATSERGRRDKQQFDNWSTSRGFQSGVFALNDYDYNKPPTNLLADASQPGGYAHGSMEMYDYPGRYVDQGEGKTLAQVLVQAEQAKDQRRSAHGSAPSLFPGATMTFEGHNESSENKEYLVLHCGHSYVGQSYRSGGGQGDAYNGSYVLADSDRQFRSPRTTRKPLIQGPQSAKVVADKGNESAEIDVDKLGRVLVQFYWDRKKKLSRRTRVAQFWAGAQRGALFLPRIGDEVMVAYEEGDPDRPLVVGSVYNGANTVPLTLPSKMTKSGILTQSSKGGNGYHMLLFDDTAGSESVKLRSQKDLMFKALNNEQRDIGANQTENIGGDETITVGQPPPNAPPSSGGGNFTLNAVQTATINVGPVGSPMTQIVMTTTTITLNVGPEGSICQILMGPMGITLSSQQGVSMVALAPSGVTTLGPEVNVFGESAITLAAAAVNAGAVLNTPMLNAAGGTASGLPLV